MEKNWRGRKLAGKTKTCKLIVLVWILFVLERCDGLLDVLVLSFCVGFEGTSSSSVGLVAFRLFLCG